MSPHNQLDGKVDCSRSIQLHNRENEEEPILYNSFYQPFFSLTRKFAFSLHLAANALESLHIFVLESATILKVPIDKLFVFLTMQFSEC